MVQLLLPQWVLTTVLGEGYAVDQQRLSCVCIGSSECDGLGAQTN